MADILLKDVIQYYIGCRVQLDGKEYGMLVGGDFVPNEVNQIYYSILLDGEKDIIIPYNDEFGPNLRIKPLLRPLSDMTEDEAIELAALSEWKEHFRDVKLERNQFKDIIVTWQGAPETREVFNATGELFYCAEQILYLLKKRFDIFNLISSNQAIDLTTLK
jgi:hypothetical protein